MIRGVSNLKEIVGRYNARRLTSVAISSWYETATFVGIGLSVTQSSFRNE